MWQQKFTEGVHSEHCAITKQHHHIVPSNRMQRSFPTLACLEIQETPVLIPPLAYTADECLKGLMQRELKIRLLIFITCLRTTRRQRAPRFQSSGK